MKVLLNNFAGMFSRIAKEKAPVFFMRELVNLRTSSIEGRLDSRKGAKALISAGITALANLAEFTDKGGNRQIVLLDGSSLRESAYSGGSYGAVGAIASDERSSGATVNEFNPVVNRKELRSGAGVNASTDLPFWYGYIPARSRFNSVESISAGLYLDDLDQSQKLADLISIEIFPAPSFKTDHEIDAGYYSVYAAPVFEGQRGLPTKEETFLPTPLADIDYTEVGASALNKAISVEVQIADADKLKAKRITAIDLFIVRSSGVDQDLENDPASFLERVDLNDDGKTIIELSGTSNSPANKITVSDYADWWTFQIAGLWVHDVTNDVYHRVTSYNINGSDVELTVTPNSTAGGAISLRFLSRWYSESSIYKFNTFYDKDNKELGSNMFDYLGLPRGDFGVDDLRFKYLAIAGRRALAVSFPDEDSAVGYFSKPGQVDVFPVTNKVLFADDPTGVIDIKDDTFFVFYNRSTDLISVFSNQQYRREDNFQNVGAVSQKAIEKINDDSVAIFDQTGPYLMGLHSVEYLGDPIGDWWQTGLTESQKSGCVIAFDRLGEQIFFSFPDYSTDPFTNGLVFVYDIRAKRLGKESPWYILYTDQKITAAAIATDLHLLTGSATIIRDWNNANPEETFTAWILLKMLQNPDFSRQVNMRHVMANFSGSVSLDVFKDQSASADITRTLSSRQNALLHTVADDIELKFTHSSAESGVIFRSALIDLTFLKT